MKGNNSMDALQDNEEKILNRQKAICLAILLNFDTPIIYDYLMPDAYTISKQIIQNINSFKISETMKNDIFKLVFSSKEDYSFLEYFMSGGGDNHIVRCEWFSGYGSLFAWRAGEESYARSFVEKYLSPKEINEIDQIKPFLIINKKPYSCQWFKN